MGNRKRATTALTVQSKPVEIMNRLKEELAGLTAIAETPYKTSGQLPPFGDITKETKVENLIRAASQVLGMEKGYHEAASALELGEYPNFNIGGFGADLWLSDIKLRIAVIRHADRKAKLDSLMEKAKGFMTVEDQKELFLQELESALG